MSLKIDSSGVKPRFGPAAGGPASEVGSDRLQASSGGDGGG